MLGSFILFARVFGGNFMETAQGLMSGTMAKIAVPPQDPEAFITIFRDVLGTGVALGAPVMGFAFLGSAIGQFSQGGFVLSGEGLKPNAQRFNPVKNLGNTFSAKKLVGTLRTIIKLALVAWVVWATLFPEVPAMLALSGHGPNELFSFTIRLAGRVLFKFFIFAIVLALADYLYQKFEHARGLKMSKQEVKDERKEIEGDPMVRGRQRARAMALARRRMMADVPKADVVVVNPTHCAVALRYERGRGGAPRVLAKGTDLIAAKIRAIAEEHRIPIWEDAPLAWALYKAVEIGREIPADLYKAVAELLAQVYRLKRHRRAGGSAQRRPAGAAPAPGAGPGASGTGRGVPAGSSEVNQPQDVTGDDAARRSAGGAAERETLDGDATLMGGSGIGGSDARSTDSGPVDLPSDMSGNGEDAE